MNTEEQPVIPDTSHIPEFDTLTGLRTLPAMAQAAEPHIRAGCALVVGDLNSFRLINEKYGHLAGDSQLKKAAELLQYMTRGQDLPARTGGDEFAIFLHRVSEEQQLQAVIDRIEGRFASYSEDAGQPGELSIALAGTLYQPGDTFQTMFDRACRNLHERKDSPVCSRTAVRRSWDRDITHIRTELTEELTTKGAYARDFESFKSIYRFLARYKYRGSLDVCVLLLSLTEPDETTIPLSEKGSAMHHLDDILRHSLRLGDVYTKYSSSQYLVLAIEASAAHGDIIADRIRADFIRNDTGKTLLIHECYALDGIDLPENLPL